MPTAESRMASNPNPGRAVLAVILILAPGASMFKLIVAVLRAGCSFHDISSDFFDSANWEA